MAKCCGCGEVTSCTELLPAALVSSGTSELLKLWLSEEVTSKHLKKGFENDVAEVSPQVLRCCDVCLRLSQHTLLCAAGVWVRSCGRGGSFACRCTRA